MPAGRATHLRRCAGTVAALGCGLLLAGCGGPQSILNTHSPMAHNIALLWWWMLGAAAIVFFGALGLLVAAYITRGKRGLPFIGEKEAAAEGLVIMFGIAIPVVCLVVLFGFSDVYLVKQTSPPNLKSTQMTVNVIGHQWWWEIRYPGTNAITANEIHIPTDTRVNLVATTADVIHSFWVPALNRKVDMIPGRQNRILLYTTQAGTYRGQCSQFCGLQHAHMSMYVMAQPKAAFAAWLARQESPAATPATAQARTGYRLFMNDQCASCHTIAGTPAAGEIGPDLTHLASRTSLAGAQIRNTPKQLAAWILNPQAIKPGDRMPDLGLSHAEVQDIVDYLETLR